MAPCFAGIVFVILGTLFFVEVAFAFFLGAVAKVVVGDGVIAPLEMNDGLLSQSS